MTSQPFEQLHQVWNDLLKPALRQWHTLSEEERQEWDAKAPPELKNGLTFYLATYLQDVQ